MQSFTEIENKLLLKYNNGSVRELVLSPDQTGLTIQHESGLCAISGTLPASLQSFEVQSCHALKELLKMPASLQSFEVQWCPALKELPTMPASLLSFKVESCHALKELPTMPASLQLFYVESCNGLKEPSVESLIEVNDSCKIDTPPLSRLLLSYGVRRFLGLAGIGKTKKVILSVGNVEIRRKLIEQYGWREFMLDAGAKKIHKDDFGVLYQLDLSNDHPLMMIKVVNATAEEDGSYKAYYLMVDSQLRPMWIDDETEKISFGQPQDLTGHNAVASTFGLRGEEYWPEMET